MARLSYMRLQPNTDDWVKLKETTGQSINVRVQLEKQMS